MNSPTLENKTSTSQKLFSHIERGINRQSSNISKLLETAFLKHLNWTGPQINDWHGIIGKDQ